MNKKSTNENLKRRKLVIRGEAIAALTVPQLRDVAGAVAPAASGEYWPCGTKPPAQDV
jgi:hypothetical protein